MVTDSWLVVPSAPRSSFVLISLRNMGHRQLPSPEKKLRSIANLIVMLKSGKFWSISVKLWHIFRVVPGLNMSETNSARLPFQLNTFGEFGKTNLCCIFSWEPVFTKAWSCQWAGISHNVGARGLQYCNSALKHFIFETMGLVKVSCIVLPLLCTDI